MTREDGGNASRQDIMRMTTDIVSAFASRNSIPSLTLTTLIGQVHETLYTLAQSNVQEDGAATRQKPAVPIRRSVNPDYIVCLEDGRKLKMLKRYLRAAFNMTPEEYRARWSLPQDYPMVAPNYAKKRSDFAKKMGLGKRSG
ncbi:MAG: MucR family transcriptional regulator [Rhodospirillales bacterium]|nr:MucR family transcriptional regulator [Rhodospirillales bacterium]